MEISRKQILVADGRIRVDLFAKVRESEQESKTQLQKRKKEKVRTNICCALAVSKSCQ